MYLYVHCRNVFVQGFTLTEDYYKMHTDKKIYWFKNKLSLINKILIYIYLTVVIK